MGIFSSLFGSRSVPPEPPKATGGNSEPQPLRLAIGPSPWALRNRMPVVGKVKYQFQETLPGDGNLAGMTSLQNSKGETLLVLDFHCYLRILNDGKVLLWRESGEKSARRIVFDCFKLSTLQPVSDPRAIATETRRGKLGVAPLKDSERWEVSPYLTDGTHPISVPHDWSCFEETLLLADHADVNGYDKMARAIFAFNWINRRVEVFPQDWFNTGNYDFGYQWIARVARRSDGSIIGEGIRLGHFELDETNRKVKKWFNSDPFYMIQ